MKCNTYEMTQLKIKLVKEIVFGKRKIKEVAELLPVNRRTVGRWKVSFLYEGGQGFILKNQVQRVERISKDPKFKLGHRLDDTKRMIDLDQPEHIAECLMKA